MHRLARVGGVLISLAACRGEPEIAVCPEIELPPCRIAYDEDADGVLDRVVSYTFDEEQRPVSAEERAPDESLLRSFAWTHTGQVSQWESRDGRNIVLEQQEVQRDHRGRTLRTAVVQHNPKGRSFSEHRTYDRHDRVTWYALDNDFDGALDGEVDTVWRGGWWAGEEIEEEYWTDATEPESVTTTRFDRGGRPTEAVAEWRAFDGQTRRFETTYTWDDSDRLEQRTVLSGAEGGRTVTDFAYDEQDCLVATTLTEDGALASSRSTTWQDLYRVATESVAGGSRTAVYRDFSCWGGPNGIPDL